jgi:hypothetical protein
VAVVTAIGADGVADYAVRGFIQPDRPASHDRLSTATPRAVRPAENDWRGRRPDRATATFAAHVTISQRLSSPSGRINAKNR